MVLAIVVMLAVLALSSALLLLSYSLYTSSLSGRGTDGCLELSQSISQELEHQLLSSQPDSPLALTEECHAEQPKSPLWVYLRLHLRQPDWENGKSFSLCANGDAEQALLSQDVSAKVTIDYDTPDGNIGEITITVFCQCGKKSAQTQRRYTLSIDAFDPQAADEILQFGTHRVNMNEHWSFLPVLYRETEEMP